MDQDSHGMIYIAKLRALLPNILTNFEQRWRKATKWKVNLKKVASWNYDTLIKLNRMSWIVSPATGEANAHVCDERDPENWQVQVQYLALVSEMIQ